MEEKKNGHEKAPVATCRDGREHGGRRRLPRRARARRADAADKKHIRIFRQDDMINKMLFLKHKRH